MKIIIVDENDNIIGHKERGTIKFFTRDFRLHRRKYGNSLKKLAKAK